MGAWGMGMQANDDALDAIGSAGLSSGEPKKQKRTLAALREGKITIKSLLSSHRNYPAGWIKKEPMALLGLAEYLLDEGFDLQPIKPVVRKALRAELAKRRLECWIDSDKRKAALLRFKDRLDGKEVPQDLLDQDNEGLLSKMSRMLGK